MVNLVALAIPKSYHCPMPPCAWAATGMTNSAHQRLCPRYTSLSPTVGVLSASGHTFEFQNLVPNITLWSPNLPARGFFHITLLTLHSFMLVKGLAAWVVPDHLPPTRMRYVTKRNECKICIFKLSFSSQNDLLRDQMCFKLLMPGNVCPCVKSHFTFNGFAHVPCLHIFGHRNATPRALF